MCLRVGKNNLSPTEGAESVLGPVVTLFSTLFRSAECREPGRVCLATNAAIGCNSLWHAVRGTTRQVSGRQSARTIRLTSRERS
jgi:hypothetical protein